MHCSNRPRGFVPEMRDKWIRSEERGSGGPYELRAAEPPGELPGHGDTPAEEPGASDIAGGGGRAREVRREGQGEPRPVVRPTRGRQRGCPDRSRGCLHQEVFSIQIFFNFKKFIRQSLAQSN